jgi:hypothetical protein
MREQPMSFREYVANRRVTDTPAGDFLADAKTDRGLPDAARWSELETHLRQRGASVEALAAARVVWNGYRATLRAADKTDA